MMPAERIYRALLWLYPKQHREDYGRAMLQHVHDLNRDARQRGRRQMVALWFRLVKDGLVNAVREHGEAIVSTKGLYKPVPWLSVLLATIPGLWVALSRRHADVLAPLLTILEVGFILLIALGVPVMWWRKRQFPVWGLMFAGTLTWFLTYWAGGQLSELLGLPNVSGWEMGTVLLNIALAVAFFLVLLRGQRLPGSVWAVFGAMVLIYVLGAFIYDWIQLGDDTQSRRQLQLLLASLALVAEGLMLVAVGLLAARQHGVLALLFVIGGYGYIFLDTDYLYGHPSQDWPGIPLYMVTVSLLYLVLTPVALLRAKTRRGRAAAAFGPALAFLVVRVIVPVVTTGGSLTALPPGEFGLSLIVLLSLALGWFLYDYVHGVSHQAAYEEQTPSPVTLTNN